MNILYKWQYTPGLEIQEAWVLDSAYSLIIWLIGYYLIIFERFERIETC